MMRHNFVRSGFGDEIDPQIETQLDVMTDEGLRYIELRGANDTNVLDWSDEEAARIRDALDARGFQVSAIGSPIGKVGIEDDFDEHLDRFERALELAEFFDTEYVRIFSYYIPEGDDPADWREEVLDRMATKAELAEEAGVTLVHENEGGLYGETAERCHDIVTTVGSPNLRVLFDPANFVVYGEDAYPDAFELLADYTEYIHLKDALFADGVEITPVGEGDARIPDVLEGFKERGYTGFASLEPHLAHAGKAGGFSGPEAFRRASQALVDVFEDIDATYE